MSRVFFMVTHRGFFNNFPSNNMMCVMKYRDVLVDVPEAGYR